MQECARQLMPWERMDVVVISSACISLHWVLLKQWNCITISVACLGCWEFLPNILVHIYEVYVIISKLMCITLGLKHAGSLHFPEDFSRYWSKMYETNTLMSVDFIPCRSRAQCLLLCMFCHGSAVCWGVVGEPCEIQT